MPRFQITDPQSGKTVTIEGAKAPSQQEADQIFADAGLRTSTPKKGIISSLPVIGGIANFVAPKETQMAEQTLGNLGNTAGQVGDIATGVLPFASKEQKQAAGQDFLRRQREIAGTQKTFTPQNAIATGAEYVRNTLPIASDWKTRLGTGVLRGTMNELTNENPTLGGAVSNAAMFSGGEVALPAIISKGSELAGKAGGVLKNVIKAPSYGKAASWADEIASKGTAEGKNVDWDILKNNIKERLFGNTENGTRGEVLKTKEMQKAFNKFISEQTPEMSVPHGNIPLGPQKTIGGLSPDDLLALRRQVVETYGDKGLFGNILESLGGKGKTSADKLIAKHARNVVSEELKKLVPDISNPDALYSVYKKMGGDVPTWFKRGAAALIGDTILKNTVFKKAATGLMGL